MAPTGRLSLLWRICIVPLHKSMGLEVDDVGKCIAELTTEELQDLQRENVPSSLINDV